MITGRRQMDGAIVVWRRRRAHAADREHILLPGSWELPYIVVALNKVDMVDVSRSCWKLVELENAGSCSPSTNSRATRLSSDPGVGAGGAERGREVEKGIVELMEAVDNYSPRAQAGDRPAVPDADRGHFSRSRARHGLGDGAHRAGGICKVARRLEIVGFRDTRKTVVTGSEMFKKLLDEGGPG